VIAPQPDTPLDRPSSGYTIESYPPVSGPLSLGQVLVVDDEPALLRALGQAIGHLGYKAVCVTPKGGYAVVAPPVRCGHFGSTSSDALGGGLRRLRRGSGAGSPFAAARRERFDSTVGRIALAPESSVSIVQGVVGDSSHRLPDPRLARDHAVGIAGPDAGV
jgi:hypothetical protein